MSAPANYVSIRDTKVTVMHNNLGAYEVLEISVLGPAVTARFLDAWSSLDPWDEWASHNEGGMLIDWDQQRVLVYTIYRSDGARAAYFAAVRRTWPGWHVSWAHGGLGDLERYADGDRLGRMPDDDLASSQLLEEGRGSFAKSTLQMWAFFVVEDLEDNYQAAFEDADRIARQRENEWILTRERTRVSRSELAAAIEAITGHPDPDVSWQRT